MLISKASADVSGAPVSSDSADQELTDHLLAVMAHSLLNSVSSIQTAASMLELRDRLDDENVDRIVSMIRSQADHLHEMLKDLVRTGDPALMATLDALDRPPGRSADDGVRLDEEAVLRLLRAVDKAGEELNPPA